MKVLLTFVRVYAENIDAALPFYETLLGVKCSGRFSYRAAGLELATVGQVLLLAGTAEALEPFRATKATLLVDDLDEFQRFLASNGATIIRGPQEVPTGRNMTARHADGTVVEYVQHGQKV
jgi:predicted enzyme related to lactoylglutathione lyase